MKRHFIIYLLATLSAALMTACQELHDDTLLSISVTSWTFNADGSDTLHLTVQGGDWTAEPAQDWVTVHDNGDGTASVTALENTENSQRSTTVTFRSGSMEQTLSVDQLPHLFDGEFRVMYDWADPAMSRDGRYIAGGYLEGDSYLGMFVWDLETGEYTKYPNGYTTATSVSNNGMIIMNNSSGTGALMKDGEIIDLALPEGGDYSTPSPFGCSADGSIIVGTVRENVLMPNGSYFSNHVPVKWTNGVPEIMEYPDHGMWGASYHSPGVIPRCCSADGSVIVGSEWSNTFGAIYWVDGRMVDLGNDPEYMNILVGSDGVPYFAEGIVSYAQYNTVSHNGDYIALAYRKYEGNYPVLINTRTGEVVVNKDYSYATSGTPMDDGRFFYRNNNLQAVTMTMEPGSGQTVQQYLQDTYGLRVSDDYSVSYISDDGKTILGWMVRESAMGMAYYPWYARFN